MTLHIWFLSFGCLYGALFYAIQRSPLSLKKQQLLLALTRGSLFILILSYGRSFNTFARPLYATLLAACSILGFIVTIALLQQISNPNR